MKIRMSIICALLTTFVVTVLGGCGDSSGDFFTLITQYQLNGFTKVDPNVNVSGQAFVSVSTCTQFPDGVSSFSGTTDGNGKFTVGNAALGGTSCPWNILRGASPNCPQVSSTSINVTQPGGTYPIPCSGPGQAEFFADPYTMDPTNLPSTMMIVGANMSTAFGMPQVTFYDANQTVLLTVAAINVSSDSTSLTIPTSDIVFPDGTYGAVVYIKQSNGTWNPIGGAAVNLFTPSLPPPPCNPPMPCC